MAQGDRITIIYWFHVDYEDDRTPLTIKSANLHREFADWLEEVGAINVGERGNIGLPSGSVEWRRLP